MTDWRDEFPGLRGRVYLNTAGGVVHGAHGGRCFTAVRR